MAGAERVLATVEDRVPAGVAGDPGALAAEARRRLGPPPELPSWPLVSIVVLNRDGADRLRNLLVGLCEHTDYPSLELILVDNASTDDSLDFIRSVEAPFPISILANHHNESFSDGCNQGAELAGGELLLFLNNDVEPFEPGWLRELVACLQGSGAGAASATLLCRCEEHAVDHRYGYGVQHRGLAFREGEGLIYPVLHGWEADPLDDRLGEDAERAAVAAACLLVARRAFERIGGFAHGYVYGAEDVELSLALRAAGLPVLCSGRSLAIHHPASTRRAAPFEGERARKLANRRLLWERWGPRLRREYELDLLEGGGLWAEPGRAGEASSRPDRTELEQLGFCLQAADGGATGPTSAHSLEALQAALRRRGHRSLVAYGADVDDPACLDYDVAVHLRCPTPHAPRAAQLNVLWVAGHLEALTPVECSRYDLVVGEREGVIRRLAEEGLAAESLAVLAAGAPDALAASLIAAAEARAAAVGIRTRIEPGTGAAAPAVS
jgi:GT2 family glycosyltransferase